MHPVTRQHLCPFQKSPSTGPQGRRQQRGGLYGWHFWVSTPENDKTDKNRRSVLSPLEPAAQRVFLLVARQHEMGAVKPKSKRACCQFGIACPKLAAFGWDHITEPSD
ncbi:MAG: hypothetical protein ABL866_08125 [Devosia sp.]